MPWRQERDLDIKTEDMKVSTKKLKMRSLRILKRMNPYLDLNYAELESYIFSNSDDDSNNKEISMLNPSLIDFEEERQLQSWIYNYQIKYITICAVN